MWISKPCTGPALERKVLDWMNYKTEDMRDFVTLCSKRVFIIDGIINQHIYNKGPLMATKRKIFTNVHKLV